MIDFIIALIIIAIVGGAVFYIYKEKKSGNKCVGCPHSKQCAKSRQGCGHTINNK